MTKLKKEVKMKAEIAIQKAKKQVYNGIKPKEKEKRNIKKDNITPVSFQTKWVNDPLGKQGVVFFDGYKYWLTIILPKSKENIREVSSIGLTPEQWEERNKREEKNEE